MKYDNKATGPFESADVVVRWSGGQVGWWELVAASGESDAGCRPTPTSGRAPCAGSGSWSPRGCTCTRRNGSSRQADGRSCLLASHRRAFQHPAAAVDRRGLLRNQTGSLQRRRLQGQCMMHEPTQRRVGRPLTPAGVRRRAAFCLRDCRCLRARSQ